MYIIYNLLYRMLGEVFYEFIVFLSSLPAHELGRVLDIPLVKLTFLLQLHSVLQSHVASTRCSRSVFVIHSDTSVAVSEGSDNVFAILPTHHSGNNWSRTRGIAVVFRVALSVASINEITCLIMGEIITDVGERLRKQVICVLPGLLISALGNATEDESCAFGGSSAPQCAPQSRPSMHRRLPDRMVGWLVWLSVKLLK